MEYFGHALTIMANLSFLILYLLSYNSVFCAAFDMVLGLFKQIYMPSLKCTALISSIGYIHEIFRPCLDNNG
jgi:hypothetical protein